jgi:hypothetical protein
MQRTFSTFAEKERRPVLQSTVIPSQPVFLTSDGIQGWNAFSVSLLFNLQITQR